MYPTVVYFCKPDPDIDKDSRRASKLKEPKVLRDREKRDLGLPCQIHLRDLGLDDTLLLPPHIGIVTFIDVSYKAGK